MDALTSQQGLGLALHTRSRHPAPGREGCDYAHHGRAGNPSPTLSPTGSSRRFCLLGLAQFTFHLMHDQKEVTLKAYGSTVLGPVD